MTISLRRRHHPLASPQAQREHLDGLRLPASFEQRLEGCGHQPLHATHVDTLQINLGKMCNQACSHCHVDAGPDRTERMNDDVLERCLALLIDGDIAQLDITGGAPELHPRFREVVTRAVAAGRQVMHRCNLTAILLPQYADIPGLLAEHRVEIIASLPYYLPKQTDAQRGNGVFDKSIRALQMLNQLGYGREGGDLTLNLVTNPVGAFLPAKQGSLEKDWKRELEARHQIRFNQLFTITNMPISRFLEWLEDSGNLESYMDRLVQAFNPSAVDGVMCRNLVSIGYDGTIYDCDFNQMLEIPAAANGYAPSIMGVDPSQLANYLRQRPIRTGPHCYGCTAGAGSSCGGATV